jgi:hypothetical protein
VPRSVTRRRPTADLQDSGGDEFSSPDTDYTPDQDMRTTRRGASTTRASRPARDSAPAASTRVSKGWGGVRKHREESSSYASNFKVSDEEVLVKFLDDEPFVTYYQHWLQELDGKKSFTCLGDDCPLCEIGDDPRFLAVFNVIDLRDDPEVKIWEASPQPAGEIEEISKNSRTSPLNRDDLYFAVSKKKGKNGFWAYTILPVKERDLPEDWDMDPLTPSELSGLTDKMYDESIVRISTREELLGVVDDLEG